MANKKNEEYRLDDYERQAKEATGGVVNFFRRKSKTFTKFFTLAVITLIIAGLIKYDLENITYKEYKDMYDDGLDYSYEYGGANLSLYKTETFINDEINEFINNETINKALILCDAIEEGIYVEENGASLTEISEDIEKILLKELKQEIRNTLDLDEDSYIEINSYTESTGERTTYLIYEKDYQDTRVDLKDSLNDVASNIVSMQKCKGNDTYVDQITDYETFAKYVKDAIISTMAMKNFDYEISDSITRPDKIKIKK